MIRKEDVKKMLVSEDGKYWKERYVLFESPKGYVAVYDGDEDKFESNDAFETIVWSYCKPLPEKKKRPMTRNEVLKFVLANHDKILIGDKDDWDLPGYWSADYLMDKRYIFIDELGTDHETPKKFEIEED